MTILDPIPPGVPRIGVLPGSFNPPTRAHIELARSALSLVDAVLFVLPRAFPHKDWQGATPEQRTEMLQRLTAVEPQFGTAVSEGGLYIEMAREAQAAFPHARIALICGQDAAERISNWNYDEPGVFERMLDEFELLVAPRCIPVPAASRGIRELPLAPECQAMSATLVREKIHAGEPWEDLIPAGIRDLVARIYS